jgi:hypothetical protein
VSGSETLTVVLLLTREAAMIARTRNYIFGLSKIIRIWHSNVSLTCSIINAPKSAKSGPPEALAADPNINLEHPFARPLSLLTPKISLMNFLKSSSFAVAMYSYD